jgi:hypothetical protein
MCEKCKNIIISNILSEIKAKLRNNNKVKIINDIYPDIGKVEYINDFNIKVDVSKYKLNADDIEEIMVDILDHSAYHVITLNYDTATYIDCCIASGTVKNDTIDFVIECHIKYYDCGV